jgi:hypothetical protein
MKECLRVTGDCMYPLLQEGDEILIEPDSRVRMGDVIVFLSRGFLQIHRALLVLPNGWILQKADRLQNYSWIRKEEVISLVRSIRRKNSDVTVDSLRARLKGLLYGYKSILKKNLTKTAEFIYS